MIRKIHPWKFFCDFLALLSPLVKDLLFTRYIDLYATIAITKHLVKADELRWCIEIDIDYLLIGFYILKRTCSSAHFSIIIQSIGRALGFLVLSKDNHLCCGPAVSGECFSHCCGQSNSSLLFKLNSNFNFILRQNRRKTQSDFLFDNVLSAQVSKRRWSWSWGEVLPGLLQQHLLCLWRSHRHQDCQRRQGDTTFKSSFHLTSSFNRPPSIFSSTMSLWRDFWERSSTWPSLTATIIRFGQNCLPWQFPENPLDHSHAGVLNQNMLNI